VTPVCATAHVLIDRAGNIIIADTNNGRVRKVVNGIITASC